MARPTSSVRNVLGAVESQRQDASELMRSPLERYFQVSVLLLLASGFVTVAATGSLDVVSILAVSVAFVLRGWFLATGRTVSMPRSWDSYFTAAYVGFYAADYFLLTHSFVSATVHLVLFSMVVKLFSVRRDRDYVYLTVLAFAEVLAASVLTVDTVFLGAFLVFALLAVNTFVAFEIRRSWAANPNAKLGEPYGKVRRLKLTRSLAGVAPILVIGILAISSGLFFVLPRVAGGYFSRFAQRNRIETGFSDNVQLGQIGEIQQSNSVAMHIEIEGDTKGAHDLKWRGVALALFDGRQWFNPLPRNHAPAELPGCFNVIPPDEHGSGYACTPAQSQSRQRIRYRVLMEPIGTNVFFLAPRGESLSGNYRDVYVDAGGAVFNGDIRRSVEAYEATSDISEAPPDQLRSSADYYSSAIAIRYLQVPALDSRVRHLAEQVTGGARTPYDKATALERYLQTNFAYTLQLPQHPPRDPIANFLFERKAGHCEYFASAMAIMLRTLGIPSRLVNGFRGGEFNYVSRKYIIRARDAHSWVEAYFPGYGWVAFDPTPAAAAPNAVDHTTMGLYLDAMRNFWREWIVNYDVGHQRTLGESGVLRVSSVIERSRTWFRTHYVSLLLRAFDLRAQVARSSTRWIYGSLICAAVLLLLLNTGRLLKSLDNARLTRNPGKSAQAAASLWYRRMTRATERRGHRKLPNQTPEEFTETISDPVLRSSVAAFTVHYERARFADSATDAERLPSLYEAVRSASTNRQPDVSDRGDDSL